MFARSFCWSEEEEVGGSEAQIKSNHFRPSAYGGDVRSAYMATKWNPRLFYCHYENGSQYPDITQDLITR